LQIESLIYTRPGIREEPEAKNMIRNAKGGKTVAKKYNRGRQQKRNIDRGKLDKYREEVARELGVELPEKRKKTVPRGNTSTYKVDDDKRLY
jgi:hypothetical protein